MSVPIVLEHQHRLPAHHRVLPLLAVGAARLLITLRPRRLRRVLEFARRGAQPATVQQAHTARQAVVAVSLRCAGKGCLQRSIAAALHCRAHGSWPTWCTGVRTNPFTAHAWIQVGDQPIGELHPAGHYRALITIPPATSHPDRPPGSFQRKNNDLPCQCRPEGRLG
ncbi:MAG: lasso peptide biosynthesis B2 protein [Pseudonocardiaceae bacterium]